MVVVSFSLTIIFHLLELSFYYFGDQQIICNQEKNELMVTEGIEVAILSI
jgi:hypothetical protein